VPDRRALFRGDKKTPARGERASVPGRSTSMSALRPCLCRVARSRHPPCRPLPPKRVSICPCGQRPFPGPQSVQPRPAVAGYLLSTFRTLTRFSMALTPELYARLDATALADAIRQGETGPEQVLDCATAMIDLWQPRLNAITWLD